MQVLDQQRVFPVPKNDLPITIYNGHLLFILDQMAFWYYFFFIVLRYGYKTWWQPMHEMDYDLIQKFTRNICLTLVGQVFLWRDFWSLSFKFLLDLLLSLLILMWWILYKKNNWKQQKKIENWIPFGFLSISFCLEILWFGIHYLATHNTLDYIYCYFVNSKHP